MDAKTCTSCKTGELISDKRMAGLICMNCGECYELGAFTDEVGFREDERGRYTATGATYNVEKGFANSQFRNHRQMKASVDNARGILKRYCDKLSISETYGKTAAGFYQQLLVEKFMNGRRLNVVLAACLYLSVRIGNANVILLDISDIAEANVYDIMRYFFKISIKLRQNVQTVDPCEYTVRFVDMLNLGDRDLPQVKRTALNIRETANRLVQRMKRDWIHFGRRPSGVCAAAVMVAARINNVNCSIKEIISLAKVCESTVRKRINEFIETPASQLTVKEFFQVNDILVISEDPPAFKNRIMKSVEENLGKVEQYQKFIEEKLRESRQGMRGTYANFIQEIFKDATPKDIEAGGTESEIIHDVIVKESAEVVKDFSDDISFVAGSSKGETLEYWTELRPTPESLGLGKNYSKKRKVEETYFDEDNCDDIDDEEIDMYIITDKEEITKRNYEWGVLNKDFLEEEDKRQKKRLEDEAAGIVRKPKPKRKKADQDEYVPSTTSEAVSNALKSKNIPTDIDHLKKLFKEDHDDEKEEGADEGEDDEDLELQIEEEIEADLG